MSEENEKILLIQDDEPRKETKWSLRRYLTEVWHYKWWVLGSTALLAVAGALGVQFLYNRSEVVYSTTFGLEIPARSVTDNGVRGPAYVLFDNNTFAATDFYSEKTIKTIIDSSDEFAGLDAKKMASHGSLSIAGGTNNGVFTAAKPYTLTLSFRASDFRSEAQASLFVSALIDHPVSLAINALSEHEEVSSFYEGFADLDYVKQMEVLTAKSAAISKVYSDLLSSAPNASSLRLTDGLTTLGEAEEAFRLSHIKDGTVDLSLYSGQLETNCYLQFTNTDEGIAAKKEELETIAVSEIGNVKASISSLASANEAFKRLADTKNIVSSDTAYASELLRLNQMIETETSNLGASLKSLKRIGYSSGDSSLDILNVKTLAEADKIAVLDSSAPVKDWGYLQYLANPTTNDWGAKCAKFEKTLLEAKDVYSADLERVNDIFVFLTSAQARSYIGTSSIVSKAGGINVWLGATAGLLLGYLASSLICTFVGIWKEDKEEEKALQKAAK